MAIESQTPNVSISDLSNRTRVLAANYYTSSDVLTAEKEQLFFKHWQYACHAAELAEPGSYRTLSIFDQSIILLRTQNGEIKAYYNVCPHRGHILLEGGGQKRAITCPYHAWTFALDGRLLSARGTKGSNICEEIALFEIRVEQLLDFIFINLDPKAKPLADVAPGLAQQVLQAVPDVINYRPVKQDEEAIGFGYLCESNWKVMVDNYLECYHCESAHKSFNDMMDIPNSRFELYPNYTFQVAPTAYKPDNAAFPLNLEHDVTVGHFWYLFPNTVFGQFPGVPGFYISRFEP